MSLLETFNWREAAEALSDQIPLEKLHPEVVDFLFKHIDEHWGIACSGGADSLSLLLLIYRSFFDKVKGLHVFHYNHKLRGEESDGEEEFVRTCVKDLQLPLIVGEGNGLTKDRSEESLRKNRHQFFNESLKAMGGRILLMGHQRDDVAETMLMRLARGSGTGGLCAPRPVNVLKEGKIHVRPLLNIGKSFLLEKLEKEGISWCKDSSNESEYYFRNRVRRNVLPEWETACVSNFWKGIERSRALLEEDDSALEYCLKSIIGSLELIKGSPFQMSVFKGKPKALYRRFLHQWLYVNGIYNHLNALGFTKLLDKIIDGADIRISVGNDQEIIFNQGLLILKNLKNDAIDWQFTEKVIEPGLSIALANHRFLEAEELNLTNELKNNIFDGEINPDYQVYLNYDDKLNLNLIVRSWYEGDRYRALGSSGTRKLQDMFTDRKIAIEKRRTLPIVCEKRLGVIWCPGLPISESLKIERNTANALKLTFK